MRRSSYLHCSGNPFSVQKPYAGNPSSQFDMRRWQRKHEVETRFLRTLPSNVFFLTRGLGSEDVDIQADGVRLRLI